MRPSIDRRCGYCDAPFRTRASKASVCCSKRCAALLRRHGVAGPSSALEVADCMTCGRAFVSRRGAARCSDDCNRRANADAALARYYRLKAEQADGRTPAEFRRNVDRRSARLAAAYVEDVAVAVLAERDRWVCHLCSGKVPHAAQFPDPGSATIDHLVPLAAGGEHSYRNTALAHLRCNTAKGARAANDQLRLIG